MQAPYFTIDWKQSVCGPFLLVALLIKTFRGKVPYFTWGRCDNQFERIIGELFRVGKVIVRRVER